ncbi:hypothetical protein LTR62_007951 [Meristemomyces frigidus]|uniref:Zn(2)-C6 fungal-type domain-containing protein n=1 Tax=Meristemomyces frigidus TaxID=1508187 RepID=A0AAN7TN37_9PEZI|nr:hypothetical protein LTR62_007951 [Meristemomyces frigidus]
MTSVILPMDPPPVDSVANNASAGPPPRKRRRRTAGGGAQDDCFACRKRAVKCDRKRPYCTQCIDLGKECSGYKTTLTWGVGVASRGKLRGLTCPVANKNPDGSNISPTEAKETRRRKSSLSFVKKEEGVANGSHGLTMAGMASTPEHGEVTGGPTRPMPIPQPRLGWQVPGFQEHMEARQQDQGQHASLNLPPLHQLQTGFNSHYSQMSIPGSAMSLGSYAETEYHSPMEYPQTPGSMHFSDGMSNQYSEQPMASGSMVSFPVTQASSMTYSEAMDVGGYPDFDSAGTMNPMEAQLDTMLFGTDPQFASPDQVDEKTESDSTLAIFDPRFANPFYNLAPRLQSLMEYYDRFVCPFLVAFDGPQNPYRRHVLQLAVHNEGLQNAIAALATNNMRMRKKRPQQIGFIEELNDGIEIRGAESTEVTAEESLYKQISIDQLNMQLSDSRAAQDDSVLATLLILCLFHVCDSGFSKFKTQLAGVQKLLSLRNPNVQSDFTGWVEMFFTWFDVMTSTVNDREMQIKGDSLDMLDFSANLGALEQFSGCDGRLFKIIARLGRLNLLAQGRPVRRNGRSDGATRPPALHRPTSRYGRKKRPTAKAMANRSLSPSDYENMDGNGWGTPILSSDEDADGSADEEVTEDDRKEFWAEWKEVRTRLQVWQMDPTAIPTSSPNVPTDPAQLEANHRDLIHINESFRFSALLYIERLANPLLPSSHPQFQILVSEALTHISSLSVTSCVNKFLLWPLFITGTECVDPTHRDVVRSRCIEIQRESGFFNNISGLEVLERVWEEVGQNVAGMEGEEVRARRRDSEAVSYMGWGRVGGGVGVASAYRGTGMRPRYGGQAFRWRKAMDRVDGEYIVI